MSFTFEHGIASKKLLYTYLPTCGKNIVVVSVHFIFDFVNFETNF